MAQEPEDPDRLKEESKESIERVRKMVEDYEKVNSQESVEPPLIRPQDSN